MRVLLDFDILLYEVGFGSQFVNEKDELVARSFEDAVDLLKQRVSEIEAEVWSNEPTMFFLTNTKVLNSKVNKARKREDKPPVEHKDNFRSTVAKTKKYKGNRKAAKPLHYDNLLAYMLINYDVHISNGLEADDSICIEHCRSPPLSTIICTRDKDLRQVAGMHYGWPVGNQPAFGPKLVTEFGELELRGGKKLVGNGLAFQYAQVLTGDPVDNYGGLPRCGPIKAYALLKDAVDERGLFEAVKEAYKEKFEEVWEEKFLEQMDLAYMVRVREGDWLKLYSMPDGEERWLNVQTEEKRGCPEQYTETFCGSLGD